MLLKRLWIPGQLYRHFPCFFVFAPALKTSPGAVANLPIELLADLVAFRYQSPWAGTVATIVILVGVTPLLALQIRAVADTANSYGRIQRSPRGRRLLRPDHLIRDSVRHVHRAGHPPRWSGHGYRLRSSQQTCGLPRGGIVRSLRGFQGTRWNRPVASVPIDLVSGLKETDYFSSFHVSALLFFTAAVAMPHMFYMTFNESNGQARPSPAGHYFFFSNQPPLFPICGPAFSPEATQVEYFDDRQRCL